MYIYNREIPEYEKYTQLVESRKEWYWNLPTNSAKFFKSQFNKNKKNKVASENYDKNKKNKVASENYDKNKKNKVASENYAETRKIRWHLKIMPSITISKLENKVPAEKSK
jgi:hypothetical protein